MEPKTKFTIILTIALLLPGMILIGAIIIFGDDTMSNSLYMAEWAVHKLNIGGYQTGFAIMIIVPWSAIYLLTACTVRQMSRFVFGTGERNDKAVSTQAVKTK